METFEVWDIISRGWYARQDMGDAYEQKSQ